MKDIVLDELIKEDKQMQRQTRGDRRRSVSYFLLRLSRSNKPIQGISVELRRTIILRKTKIKCITREGWPEILQNQLLPEGMRKRVTKIASLWKEIAGLKLLETKILVKGKKRVNKKEGL